MIKERGEFSMLNEVPFTSSDRMLVRHLREDWAENNYWVLLAAAFCNLSVREGHTYFDLQAPQLSSVSVPRSWPDLARWQELLAASRIVGDESTSDDRPLILSGSSCLYLEKYYRYERRLAEQIRNRARGRASTPVIKDPVERAAQRSFFVITGGPGTGKTTLALRYLDRLLNVWTEQRPARFAAIAPTGKAAARLAESISNGVQRLEVNEKRKEELKSIPCLTIHRLMGTLPHRASFRRSPRHPLAYDALVVDESSMIDLPLMMRLFEALPPRCQVLLLGDKDQLASVDVGSVLSDILLAAESGESILSDSVERLIKTYRFSEDSGIYQLCTLAKEGDLDAFNRFLEAPPDDVRFHRLESGAKRIPNELVQLGLAQHRRLSKSKNARLALGELGKSMMLTPTRNGPFGTIEYNRRVRQQVLSQLDLVGGDDLPFHGEPIIVLENDYELELFNGDIGLIWEDGDGLFACFESATSGVRKFRATELPRYESAFALTIHKSQGSEFDCVNCLFGPDAGLNLTRELIYTAFSRAKKELVVFGVAESMRLGITQQAVRATRLAELLSEKEDFRNQQS
ncbi:exodeoxyribonuclease V subunit alpha [Pelagicoccus sp. SDUM812002]|uniref:exodeoxyribonuclease V subunit alpha n=1 Tax=Pelagicoccus sp. SDUM812002 TaxID=3041266 RepID=UPI0028108695|nr:exodeoxyribonuclease V subunit alpha [Pelagicoccus sp. SDUM812002]MDQ8187747.1 exodeoxyribonuclease V subunit alpha [Pelagicoccus sp. SDUM812002]